jgi:glycosyltransferase involved in cell wall biosynthesis
MSTDIPVSVIICAYNAEKYLEKTINSVLSQTYRNIEVLIIDDASTDSTFQIIQEAGENDERIRYVKLSENSGLANARKIGLENAKYDWILFIDADDIALPEMLATQIEAVTQEPYLIAAGTYAYYIGEDENKIIGMQAIGPISDKEFFNLYKKNKLIFLPASSLFSKKDALLVGGHRIFDKSDNIKWQDFCEDLDLWCRLSDLGVEGKYMKVIPKPLFLYRKRQDSISTNVFSMLKKMRWIKDCLKRRRSGLSERTYEDFINSLSLWTKFNNLRKDYAAFFYRKAGFNYMNKNYIKTLVNLLMVMVLNPGYIFDKLKTQKFYK